jgi:PRTRC genetic system protein A
MMRLPKFIEYKIATEAIEPITAIMFEYLLAGNGLFVRAKRNEFSVCFPISSGSIKGLPSVSSGIVWHKPVIPINLWQEVLENARISNGLAEFKEDVFVIFWHSECEEWRWKNISKERSSASTLADDSIKEYGEACIELHTHPDGAIHFSSLDDRDESDKFRIFAILTDVKSNSPSIRFRCGVYQYFFPIPAPSVSEMPAKFIDLSNSLRPIGLTIYEN